MCTCISLNFTVQFIFRCIAFLKKLSGRLGGIPKDTRTFVFADKKDLAMTLQ